MIDARSCIATRNANPRRFARPRLVLPAAPAGVSLSTSAAPRRRPVQPLQPSGRPSAGSPTHAAAAQRLPPG